MPDFNKSVKQLAMWKGKKYENEVKLAANACIIKPYDLTES